MQELQPDSYSDEEFSEDEFDEDEFCSDTGSVTASPKNASPKHQRPESGGQASGDSKLQKETPHREQALDDAEFQEEMPQAPFEADRACTTVSFGEEVKRAEYSDGEFCSENGGDAHADSAGILGQEYDEDEFCEETHHDVVANDCSFQEEDYHEDDFCSDGGEEHAASTAADECSTDKLAELCKTGRADGVEEDSLHLVQFLMSGALICYGDTHSRTSSKNTAATIEASTCCQTETPSPPYTPVGAVRAKISADEMVRADWEEVADRYTTSVVALAELEHIDGEVFMRTSLASGFTCTGNLSEASYGEVKTLDQRSEFQSPMPEAPPEDNSDCPGAASSAEVVALEAKDPVPEAPAEDGDYAPPEDSVAGCGDDMESAPPEKAEPILTNAMSKASASTASGGLKNSQTLFPICYPGLDDLLNDPSFRVREEWKRKLLPPKCESDEPVIIQRMVDHPVQDRRIVRPAGQAPVGRNGRRRPEPQDHRARAAPALGQAQTTLRPAAPAQKPLTLIGPRTLRSSPRQATGSFVPLDGPFSFHDVAEGLRLPVPPDIGTAELTMQQAPNQYECYLPRIPGAGAFQGGRGAAASGARSVGATAGSHRNSARARSNHRKPQTAQVSADILYSSAGKPLSMDLLEVACWSISTQARCIPPSMCPPNPPSASLMQS